MSRLHSLRASIGEVARYLDADAGDLFAVPPDVTEGREGPVMFEAGGRRRLRMMRWGFPRRIRDKRMEGREADIIGLVADLTNPMWEQTVVGPRYRCIIPMTHFGNPKGVSFSHRQLVLHTLAASGIGGGPRGSSSKGPGDR